METGKHDISDAKTILQYSFGIGTPASAPRRLCVALFL